MRIDESTFDGHISVSSAEVDDTMVMVLNPSIEQ
jgi:hypothetical protein